MPSRRKYPDWREFERLVARIEADAGPHGMVVTSPDRIKCKVTGKKREVDASIRCKVGTVDMLITIECRRRSAVQDVTWVEQLVNKQKAIGADRTIAVSSSGFTEPAKKVASLNGISIRKLSEISVDDITKILRLDFVLFWHKASAIAQIGIRKFRSLDWKMPAPEDVDFVLPKNIDPFTAIFRNNDTGETWSTNDLWLQLQEATNPFEGIDKSQPPMLRTACFPYPGTVTISGPDGDHILGDVILTVALWIEAEQVTVNTANKVEYSSEDETAIQRVDFTSQQNYNDDWRISLQAPKGSDNNQDVVIGGNWPNPKP